jgi:hypothetical protein
LPRLRYKGRNVPGRSTNGFRLNVPIRPRSHNEHFRRLGYAYVQRGIVDGTFTGADLCRARDWVAGQDAWRMILATLCGAVVAVLVGLLALWGSFVIADRQLAAANAVKGEFQSRPGAEAGMLNGNRERGGPG